MEELKKYEQWCPIFEEETGMKIMDNDGGRNLASENKTDILLSKNEAYKYFQMNTVIGIPKIF